MRQVFENRKGLLHGRGMSPLPAVSKTVHTETPGCRLQATIVQIGRSWVRYGSARRDRSDNPKSSLETAQTSHLAFSPGMTARGWSAVAGHYLRRKTYHEHVDAHPDHHEDPSLSLIFSLFQSRDRERRGCF